MIEPFDNEHKGRSKGNSVWRFLAIALLPILIVSVLIGCFADWGIAATVFFGLLGFLEYLRQLTL